MELNRRKYNWIVFALIILISGVIIFSAVELTQADSSLPTDIIAEPDLPQDENLTEDITVPSNKNYLPSAPSFSSGWKALSYAYSIMENYSFISTLSQTAINDEILGIVIRQNVTQTKYKTKDGCLILASGSCDNSEGANYSLQTYLSIGDQTVIRKICSNSDYNFTTEKFQNYTLSDFKNKYGQDVINSYFKLNSSNSTLDSFNIMGANYVLKLTINSNAEGVFDNMQKALLSSPTECRNAKGISATFEIKINRKTGAFESIKSVERYYIEKKTSSFGWQGSKITSTISETFSFADINIDNLVNSVINK